MSKYKTAVRIITSVGIYHTSQRHRDSSSIITSIRSVSLFPTNNDENLYFFQQQFHVITFQKEKKKKKRKSYVIWSKKLSVRQYQYDSSIPSDGSSSSYLDKELPSKTYTIHPRPWFSCSTLLPLGQIAFRVRIAPRQGRKRQQAISQKVRSVLHGIYTVQRLRSIPTTDEHHTNAT